MACVQTVCTLLLSRHVLNTTVRVGQAHQQSKYEHWNKVMWYMFTILSNCYYNHNKLMGVAPSKVNNLMCSARSPTEVNVMWTRPSQTNGVIRHYEIMLRDRNTGQNMTTFVNNQSTLAIINHLEPNHNYTCSVAAHTISRGSFTQVDVSVPRMSKCGYSKITNLTSTIIIPFIRLLILICCLWDGI